MATFKEGDWVRMTEDDWNGGYKSGDVFRLTGISERGVRFTDNDGDARYADHDSGRFEPWTPKVGERVRMVRAVDGHKAECGATVVHDDMTSFMLFLIEFDEPQAWAHRGDGRAKEGRRWWVDAADLEPLPVAAEAQPAAPALLTIQAGKFYKTRDGRKVGPMEWCTRGKEWATAPGFCVDHWYTQHNMHFAGSFANCRACEQSPDDLIAEWPADATNVAATVDALDEEYGPGVAVADVQKYRKGDRVVCLGDANGQFTKGKIYTVGTDFCGRRGESVKIAIDDAGSKSNGWMPKFFAPALTQTPTPAIVCLVDNGHPLPATRPRIHDSVEAANKEAARLSGVHKGQEFGVFSMTGTPHKVEKTYEHEWQRLADQGKRADAEKELRRITGMSHSLARYVVSNRAA